MKTHRFSDLVPGLVFDLGHVELTKEEIISFAQAYDPMPFHVDEDAAKESIFGKLIASGPHLFHAFYLREWVPRFKDSVMAGRGIHAWNLHRPVYPNQAVFCELTVEKAEPKPHRGFGVVDWYFTFRDAEGQLVQDLHMVVMHKLQ
jgi:acyl dehydratase